MFLLDCCYSSNMTLNIILFYVLCRDGFDFGFENCLILAYKNGILDFIGNLGDDIYEISISKRKNKNSMLSINSTKDVLDNTYLWHCCLGHVKKKYITKLYAGSVVE